MSITALRKLFILCITTYDPTTSTDYIGIVEKNFEKVTTTGKTLRKVDLRDATNEQVRITLWPDKRHLIGDDVKRGDIVAITSTKVTQFENLIQLESTYPTEVFVNPNLTDIKQHIQRLKELTVQAIESITENPVTIQDILNQVSIGKKLVFKCNARIKEIQTNQPWFYAVCSICNKQVFNEVGATAYYVCKDDEHMQPKFKYSVHATITDEALTTNVIFFNEVMTNMLGITCQDMVVLHGYDNPEIPPPQMMLKIGIPMTFNQTLKAGGSIVIDEAIEAHKTSSTTTLTSLPGPTEKVNLTPPTPNPKSLPTKRGTNEPSGTPIKKQKH